MQEFEKYLKKIGAEKKGPVTYRLGLEKGTDIALAFENIDESGVFLQFVLRFSSERKLQAKDFLSLASLDSKIKPAADEKGCYFLLAEFFENRFNKEKWDFLINEFRALLIAEKIKERSFISNSPGEKTMPQKIRDFFEKNQKWSASEWGRDALLINFNGITGNNENVILRNLGNSFNIEAEISSDKELKSANFSIYDFLLHMNFNTPLIKGGFDLKENRLCYVSNFYEDEADLLEDYLDNFFAFAEANLLETKAILNDDVACEWKEAMKGGGKNGS